MDNDVISRREFGTVTAGASIGLLAPTQSLAESVGSGAPVNYSRGLIESPFGDSLESISAPATRWVADDPAKGTNGLR